MLVRSSLNRSTPIAAMKSDLVAVDVRVLDEHVKERLQLRIVERACQHADEVLVQFTRQIRKLTYENFMQELYHKRRIKLLNTQNLHLFYQSAISYLNRLQTLISGIITNRGIGAWFDLPHKEIRLLLGH